MLNEYRLFELLERYREQIAVCEEITPANLGIDADTFAQVVQLYCRSKAIETRLSPVRMPNPRPGVATDRYQTTRLLGSGGYGDVFLTDDRELGRAVALKVLRPLRTATGVANDRLRAEAVLMGRLDHPGVPAVHSLGTDKSGRPFYTMRLVDGTTMADEIDRLHLSLPVKTSAREFRERLRPLLRRFVSACAAIAYANSQGVIHRDIKPANIMLGAFDETLVMDWGLARAVGTPNLSEKIQPEHMPVGLTAGAVGTVGYIAPEQWAADPTIDHKADVYSLGAILYHLLAGRPSLTPDDLGKGFRAEKVRPLLTARSGLPLSLVAVCEKAMAAAPAQRYASAEALSADVQSWLDDRPVSVYREPLVDRVARWTRRHRTGVSIVATALPLLLALGIGEWLARRNLGDAEARRANAISEKEKAEQDAENTRERIRQSARDNYPTALEVIDQRIERGYLGDADNLLNEQLEVLTKVGEHSGFEWTHRKAKVSGQPPFEFNAFHVGSIVGLHQSDAYSPLISVAEDGFLVRWDTNSGRMISGVTLDFGQKNGTSGFKHQVIDGRRRVTEVIPGFPAALARPPMVEGDVIVAVGPSAATLTPVDGLSDDDFLKLIPSAAGAKAYFETTKPDGSGRRVITLTRSRGFQPFSLGLNGLATFSRDGLRVALALMRDEKGVWKTNANSFESRSWAPVVVVFDTSTGNRLCEIKTPKNTKNMKVSALSFKPDGTEILVGFDSENPANQDKQGHGYRVYDSSTGLEKSRLAWPANSLMTEGVGPMAYSPDGQRIYGMGVETYLDDSIGYWQTDKRNAMPVTVAARTTASVIDSQMQLSDDGRWAIIHGLGGVVIVNTSGGEARPLTELSGSVRAAAFDPRGRLLAATDNNRRLIIWDLASLKVIRETTLLDNSLTRALFFSRDARQVFVAQHTSIIAYPVERTPAERTFGKSEGGPYGAAAIHPSGELLSVSGESIRRDDLRTNRSRGVLASATSQSQLSATQVSPDGTRVAMAVVDHHVGDVPEVVVFDVKTSRVIHRVSLPPELGQVTTLCWLPDGKRLLIGELNSEGQQPKELSRVSHAPIPVGVCDLTTGRVDPVMLSDSGAADIAVSVDGKYLVISSDHSVYIRDANTLQLRYRLRLDQPHAKALAISSDSRWCVVGCGVPMSQLHTEGKKSMLQAFDLESGQKRFNSTVASDGLIGSIDISPDGKTIACGTTSGKVDLISSLDGKVVGTITVNDTKGSGVTGVGFVDRGRNLVAASMQLMVLDTNALMKPSASVAKFSLPDGKRLAKIGGDLLTPELSRSASRPNTFALVDSQSGTVRLYDSANWAEPLSRYQHERPVAVSQAAEFTLLAVSSDGRHVAGATFEGEIAVYSHPEGKMIRRWKAGELKLTPATLQFTSDGTAVIVAGIVSGKVGLQGQVLRCPIEGAKPDILLETPPVGIYAAYLPRVMLSGLFVLADDASTLFVALAGAKRGEGEVLAQYSLQTGRETARHPLPQGSNIAAIAFDPFTASVFASIHDRIENAERNVRTVSELIIWNSGKDTTRRIVLESTRWRRPGLNTSSIGGWYRLTPSTDGRLLAMRNWMSGDLKILDLRTGRWVFNHAATSGHGPLIFTKDGRTLANVLGNGIVQLFTSGVEK